MTQKRVLIFLILILNIIRFVGLDQSPPGFYVDEAAGAAQVMCIKETGADLFRNSTPLFTPGLGGGYYTAPYVYGSALWTSMVGNSTAGFRSFLAFITCLSVAMIYLWVRRRTTESTALIAALLASISPWAFQFSRIAWDPPLAPFFILLGLYLYDLQYRFRWIPASLAFALASYAYPGNRIQAAALLFLIPGIHWREKLKGFGAYLVFLIPLILKSIEDPMFTARARMLIIWSGHPMNPFHEDHFFGLCWDFIQNILLHLTPEFLLVSGDHNLRHSTQMNGMMSYPEYLILTSALIVFLVNGIRKRKIIFDRFPTFLFAAAILGITPAALTWESVPHALRAIGAWPFFVMLAAYAFSQISKRYIHSWTSILIASSLGFACYFNYYYFTSYPELSASWFQTEQNPIGTAYQRMINDGISCDTIQKEFTHGTYRGR